MATINSREDIEILKIGAFLGLNENPDGDTTLKNGEMASMRNFRITQDRHLQTRPGSRLVISLNTAWNEAGGAETYGVTETRFCGAWRGEVGEQTHIVASYGGGLFAVDPITPAIYPIGECTQSEATFFGFGGYVYMLNGHEYMKWDGDIEGSFVNVEGYVPLIQLSTPPAGGGTLLENVNRLTPKRRVQFSPDGTATEFVLPEQNLASVDAVTEIGEAKEFTADTENGKVTFAEAPTAGTNTIEVTYTAGADDRATVQGMRFSELYNGSNDTRVFLYGDGTNKTIYSGVEYATGQGSAEYFPDLYEAEVGESNTPITALVRHFSRLMAYKPNSAWVIQYGTIDLEDGTNTAAFYVQPVNRQFGNEAPGQVKLLENNPLTLDVGSVYQWRTGTGYVANTENNARRVSDRVSATLSEFDFAKIKTFNVKKDHEYWLMYGTRAIILNYANDTWYVYHDLPFTYLLEAENILYGFHDNGNMVEFSKAYRRDNGGDLVVSIDAAAWEAGEAGGKDGKFTFTYGNNSWQYEGQNVNNSDFGLDVAGEVRDGTSVVVERSTADDVVSYTTDVTETIDCYAATGAMDFDRDWVTKYSPMIFVAMQPQTNARIIVTVESNRRSDYPEKVVAYSLSTFTHVDFNHFSFATNRKPQVKRVKMKVKKATFYRLIFKSNSASATATVVETDVRLRYAGYVK